MRPDNTMECWGHTEEDEYDFGQISDAPDEDGTVYRHVGLGLYHGCVVQEDGSISCWGQDTYGQTTPPERNDYVYTEGGDNFSCGLRSDGIVDCWGAKGTADVTPEEQTFESISAGYVFVCGITPEAELMCWGVDHPYIDSFPGWVGWE